MMTIHKIYQPSTPALVWGGSLAAFVAVLGFAIGSLGGVADAETAQIVAGPLPAAVEATVSEQPAQVCDGVIFRDEDPLCFALEPHPDDRLDIKKMYGTILAPAPGSAGS